jgi:hypothetical protein
MKGVTDYQLEILRHVSEAPESDPLDFDQLLEKLSWAPSKESAQFPIRSLVSKKLLAKGPLTLRRGRKRVVYLLTEEGRILLDPRLVPGRSGAAEILGTENANYANSAPFVVGKLSTEDANFENFSLPPELSLE